MMFEPIAVGVGECLELGELGQGVFVDAVVATQALELPLAVISSLRKDYVDAPYSLMSILDCLSIIKVHP